MRVWRIVPVTPASDPRWQDHRIWREVLVRAESAAMARLLASELESGGRAVGVGNETLKSRSAFDDEKLYWVMEADIDPAEATGGPGVLSAEPLEGEQSRPGTP